VLRYISGFVPEIAHVLTSSILFVFAGTQQNLIQSILDASAPKREKCKKIVDNAYRQEGMYGGTWTRTGDNRSSVGLVCESVIEALSRLRTGTSPGGVGSTMQAYVSKSLLVPACLASPTGTVQGTERIPEARGVCSPACAKPSPMLLSWSSHADPAVQEPHNLRPSRSTISNSVAQCMTLETNTTAQRMRRIPLICRQLRAWWPHTCLREWCIRGFWRTFFFFEISECLLRSNLSKRSKKHKNRKTTQFANSFFLILECLLRSNLSKRNKKH